VQLEGEGRGSKVSGGIELLVGEIGVWFSENGKEIFI
jgi:hypothetical protein